MFARLWWKDVRQFWPIWAILSVAAAGCQVLMLKYGGQDARRGMLLPVAMGWGLLYAFAVSTAAFAGERENNTLAFLDMLPVSRKVLWGGKASFALVTTLVFAVALAAMAWLGTDRAFARGWLLGYTEYANFNAGLTPLGKALVVLAVVAVFLEVLGWGLFWSAVSSNAMIAVVLAMVCSSLSVVFNSNYRFVRGDNFTGLTPARLAVFLATSAASAWVLTLGGRPARSWDDALTRELALGPVAIRRRRRERTPRRVLSSQVKVLVWQTMREVWPVWWRLMAIGFVLPFVCLVVGIGADLGVVNLLNQVLAVVAGVSVFGVENRNNAQRFLAHHGARPGVVWAVKVAVWAAWFVAPWFLLWVFTMWVSSPNQRADWLMSPVIAMTSAAVGLVAGMAIRRGITAGLVAVVAVFALGGPQVALANWQMLPYVVPVLVPLALVVVSWAWSADWMLERPGLARYGRLALLLAVALGGVFGAYVAIRVAGVPDVGPGFDVAAFKRAAAVDDKDNAAALYNEAVWRSQVVVVERGGAGVGPGGPVPEAKPEARRDERQELLDLIRRASAMPRCQFVRLDRGTIHNPYHSRDLTASDALRFVVADSVQKRRERGDLAGAWDDLMVMFRMARHRSGPVPIGESYMGLNTERHALGMALEWSADPRQRPERLRAALDAYRALPPMPPLIETIRAESILVENTLNLPADELSSLTAGYIARGANEFEKTASDVHLAAITSPWEVARARRAFWLLFGAIGQHASTDPTARPAHEYFGWGGYDVGTGPAARRFQGYELKQLEETTPLAQWFLPARGALTDLNDRNEVARRALFLVLALRHWQVTHDGKLPGSLFDLIHSDEVDHLPTDPYANGQPFHYEPAGGQRLLPLGHLEPWWPPSHEDKERRPISRGRLLYSVGPDLRDDHAPQDVNSRTGVGDIIFPLTEAGDAPE